MKSALIVTACTAVCGSVGVYLGLTIHGHSWSAAVPALAGATGGFGIGWAALDVIRRHRAMTAP